MPDRLRLLTWPDYLSPETVGEFQTEFELSLEVEIIASADELLARMRGPEPAPDLLCPPDYAVRQLKREGLLLTLDLRRLPNLAHLAPEFQSGRPHDPTNEVSVIKDWGTTGYMARTDLIDDPGLSWADFWTLAEQHSGRVSVLDSQSEVIGAALKLRGHSYNAEDEPALAEARRELLRLRPSIGYFKTGYRPLLGVHSAVNHSNPAERVDVLTALRLFTLNNARLGFEEREKGSLTPGKLADLVVLGADPLQVDPGEIKDIPIELTVVGGRVVYSAN